MILYFSYEAEADLEGIGDYIAQDSLRKAAEVVRHLRTQSSEILAMPEAFSLTPRYEGSGVRRRVVGSYLIFYKIEGEAVYVVRILHGASDYASILFPDA